MQKAIAFQRHFTSRNVATLLSHAHYHCDMVLAFELSRALQIVREVYWMAPTTLSQLSSFSKSARQHSKDYHVKFLPHVCVFLFVFYIIKFFSRVFLCIRLDKSFIKKVERNKCHICSKTYYIFEPWKKRRLLRLEATMPHPQQLKKKRKKGNTKVERSRELQNSSI